MEFEFRIGPEDRFEITGFPLGESKAEPYWRSGAFRLDGRFLSSPAINQGIPVPISMRGPDLVIELEENLHLQLRRQP
jgi:hypothetical protein